MHNEKYNIEKNLATPSLPPQGGEAKAVALGGWKLMPLKITEEMHVAAVRAICKCNGNADFPPRVYAAMLAAAPAAQALPVADTASADAAEQMFLVSYVGLRGLSECGIWREATEEAFHTFVPAYRRKVQVIDAALQQTQGSGA